MSAIRVLLAAAVLGMGCAPPTGSAPDAPDGGSPAPDGGTPAGPVVRESERIGGYVPALPRAVLPGSRMAWIGYQGQVIREPQKLGLTPTNDPIVASGLLALDQTNGRTRLYTAADGLPALAYPGSEDPLPGTVPFFELAWVDPDRTFVAAAWTHLVKAVVAPDAQAPTFTAIHLRAPGRLVDAAVGTVAAAGGEIFVGTDQGIAVVDPATLAVKRWVDLQVPHAQVYALSPGTLRGTAAVAVLFATNLNEAPSRVAVAVPGQASAEPVLLPEGAQPLSVLGLSGRLLVGAKGSDGRGEILGVVAGTGGLEVSTFLAAEQFSKVSAAGKPFWPGRLAWDAVHAQLVVGGLISSRTPGASGGLVSFGLDSQGNVAGALEPAFPREDPTFWFLPWQVETLVVDGQGRWWVQGQQLCDEINLRPMGLYRIEGTGADRRLVRPLVSGVHDIALDPDGQPWLGLRDDGGGMKCPGWVIQQGVCRLKADGSCEIFAPRTTGNETNLVPDLPAARIAFGSASRRELAIATGGYRTYVRVGDGASISSTQVTPGLSLNETAAAWDDDGALWLASEQDWYEPPEDPAHPTDWEAVGDGMPHGIGYLAFSPAVPKEDGLRRYSRHQSQRISWDVPGMPSNQAWDVLPLSGHRHALAALGVQRRARTYDHVETEPTRLNVRGGIAEIDGDTVHVVQPPPGVTFGDVRALARGADGTLYALDDAAGVVTVDLAAHTSRLLRPAAWGEGVRGLSLAIDEAGRIAVGTSDGVVLYGADGAVTQVAGEDGFVWRVRFVAPGVLLAGTDQGVVRLALDGAQLPAVRGREGPQAREPWPLDAACDPTTGCRCHGDDSCAYGEYCAYETSTRAFCRVRGDACAGPQKGETCACTGDADCATGLACACSAGSCACAKTPASCSGDVGCACKGDGDCATGTHCDTGAGVCAEGLPECAHDCTCETASHCPAGLNCEGGIDGNSCR